MNINTKYNGQNTSFKGITNYIVKRADLDAAKKVLVESRAYKGEDIVAFVENPKYSMIEEQCKKVSKKLDWISEHLRLKGIEFKVPEAINSRKLNFYVFDDNNTRDVGKFKSYLLKEFIESPIKTIQDYVAENRIIAKGVTNDDALDTYNAYRAFKEGESDLKKLLKGSNVETIEWPPEKVK